MYSTISSMAEVQKNDIITSNSARYLVLDFIEQEPLCKVAKCINLKTFETTAIKIYKESEDHITEVKMLKELCALDPEKNNLVRFIDHFMFQDDSCLAFEMLDRSLWDLVNQRQAPLSLNEIRPIAHQLLVAFEALKGIGVIHTDLKPDNVMLVNHQDQPFRVKLINFGLACKGSEVKVGGNMQSCTYRAPEMILGLPISEAVDMWGLGCVLAFLYFGVDIFPGYSSYHMMKTICHLIGQPEDQLLNTGKNTCQYFSWEQGTSNPEWRLKTPEECQEATSVHPQVSKCFFETVGNLKEAVDCFSEEGDIVKNRDKMAFLKLLQQLLELDAEKRITPGEALKHSFITMAHLVEDIKTSSYVKDAFELKDILLLDDLYESDDFWSGSYCCDTGRDIPPVPFQIQKSDVLLNNSTKYLVVDFIGEGGFGKVAKCVNLTTSEIRAIKIHKNSADHIAEVRILEDLRALDPEEKNLVTFIDHFMFQGVSCLTFKMLDKSLWDLMNERHTPLAPNEIRPITHQLLVAFEALKGIGVIHTDLKPNNIMLVNHQDQPFSVKLIDFGLARKVSEVEAGTNMQPCAYRAPEVTLGLPITEAIDMWGLGCVLAFLFFGIDIFPEYSTYHMMKTICHLIGQPEDHLLSAGKNTCQYFSWEPGTTNPEWRLKTPEEYQEATCVHQKVSEWIFDSVENLEEAVYCYLEEGDIVTHEDRMVFLHLLKQLLSLDAEKRISPGEALKHSFVTMGHLVEKRNTSSHAQNASELKKSSPKNDSDELDHFVSASGSVYYSDVKEMSEPFRVKKQHILVNKSDEYLVVDFIGEGCFGQVAKCINLKTNEITAIKIHKMAEHHTKEVNMLNELRALDPEEKNLVRFIDNFMFLNVSCLAFEMLDMSLWDLVKKTRKPLSFNEIRLVTHQLLVAFEALKGIGVIHTDLKPDNVMLVNHQDQPFRVKLIDFGLARKITKVKVGMNMQACAYRAPEVILGLPISEAVDMWGLGCVMAFLYFIRNLFPGNSPYHALRAVCHLLGQPENNLLNAGRNTMQYFSREQYTTHPGWRLKTPEEYQETAIVKPKHSNVWNFHTFKNLKEAVRFHSKHNIDVEDRMLFVDFLERLLDLNAERRITPGQALKHSFVCRKST